MAVGKSDRIRDRDSSGPNVSYVVVSSLQIELGEGDSDFDDGHSGDWRHESASVEHPKIRKVN